MILGIDASTSYIGHCLLGEFGQYIDLGHIDLRKHKNLYEKADIFRDFAVNLKNKYEKIDKIYVEAPLKSSNNINIVALLQRWNGILCLEIYRIFNIQPELIEHRTARKQVGIKIPKGLKGLDMKKYILQYVQSLCIIPDDMWQLKRTGNPTDFSYDMADAFVVAKAGLLKG